MVARTAKTVEDSLSWTHTRSPRRASERVPMKEAACPRHTARTDPDTPAFGLSQLCFVEILGYSAEQSFSRSPQPDPARVRGVPDSFAASRVGVGCTRHRSNRLRPAHVLTCAGWSDRWPRGPHRLRRRPRTRTPPAQRYRPRGPHRCSLLSSPTLPRWREQPPPARIPTR